jgi:Helicase HerA, central domain
MVKADADIVADAPRGAGVTETIRRILDGDLAEIAPRIERQTVEFAHDHNGEVIRLHPQCGGILIVGASGGGKSTIATGIIEHIVERGFQFCMIDPEGDYTDLEDAVVLGDAEGPPRVPEIAELLGNPEQNLVVNLLGIDLAERPCFLAELMPVLGQLRVETARPHWLLVDEVHHLLPSAWNGAASVLPGEFAGTILITVHPEHVAPAALQRIEYLVGLGDEADRAVASFCEMVGEPAPAPLGQPLDRGQALLWNRRSRELRLISTLQPNQQRQRHRRKYAEGELGADKSFYFRGPEGALNLRAQNLVLFVQIAEGIDDRTWSHHLRVGDYSRWLRDKIKDNELADEVAALESDAALSPLDSRRAVKEAIARRYTSPA